MKTEHTPIPWKYDPYWSLIMAGKTEIAAIHAATQAGELAKRKRLDEAHANAKFICRAVNAHADLMEALRECITEDGATAWRSAEFAGRRLEAISNIARAAIQKAEEQS